MSTLKGTAAARETRTHHEVKVAGVKTERDPPAAAAEDACAPLDRPASGERPLIQPQRRRRFVAARLIGREQAA